MWKGRDQLKTSPVHVKPRSWYFLSLATSAVGYVKRRWGEWGGGVCRRTLTQLAAESRGLNCGLGIVCQTDFFYSIMKIAQWPHSHLRTKTPPHRHWCWSREKPGRVPNRPGPTIGCSGRGGRSAGVKELCRAAHSDLTSRIEAGGEGECLMCGASAGKCREWGLRLDTAAEAGGLDDLRSCVGLLRASRGWGGWGLWWRPWGCCACVLSSWCPFCWHRERHPPGTGTTCKVTNSLTRGDARVA